MNASSYGYNPLAHAQGQTHDERFRTFDQLVLDLARETLQLAQRSGISKGETGETKSGGKFAFLTTS